MIYLITNTQNGKKYVGKTTNIDRRWYRHCKAAEYGSNTHFHKAIRKYGKSAFDIEILDAEYSNDAEKNWILVLAPEYNMTPGGDGGWINDQTGKTWKVKDSRRMGTSFRRGNNHGELWKHSVTGGNNYQCTHNIHTPWGTFGSLKEATDAAKKLRKNGRIDVITDRGTLKKYCSEDKILHPEGRRTFFGWRGKSTRQLGFFMEEKKCRL
jgi:group I intron endonuclease